MHQIQNRPQTVKYLFDFYSNRYTNFCQDIKDRNIGILYLEQGFQATNVLHIRGLFCVLETPAPEQIQEDPFLLSWPLALIYTS